MNKNFGVDDLHFRNTGGMVFLGGFSFGRHIRSGLSNMMFSDIWYWSPAEVL